MGPKDFATFNLGGQGSDDEGPRYPDTLKSASRLREFLWNNRVEGVFDKVTQFFIPEGFVKELFNHPGVVQEALGIQDPNDEQSDLIKFIVELAPRAFAVTVMAKINANEAMRWFKAQPMTDDELPVMVQDAQWRRSWRLEFFNAQWPFFATVFSTRNPGHNLVEAHVIPFIDRVSKAGQGSFGIVSQYTVHKDHMQMCPVLSDHTNVAVKEIQPDPDIPDLAVRWEKEIAALRKMNDLEERHIVRFLTAFRRHTRKNKDEYYLMFEWAAGGNLRTLWEESPSPALSPSLVREVVQQIFGLATALNAAHNLNKTGASYRHGDLKPENILVFPGQGLIGTLKIGDWGEAKFQGIRTEMRPSGSKSRFGTIRYEAPEVKIGIQETFLGQPRERRSRLYDIWALGCITLEFLVWLLYGQDGLTKFNAEVNGPTFYQISTENGKDEARVHDKAVYWMDRMAALPAARPYTTAIGDVLVLVRTSLLVVKLPHRLGTNLLMQDTGRVDRRRLDSGVGPGPDQTVTNSQSEEQMTGMSTTSGASSGPAINIVPADDQPEPEPTRIPVQRAPEPPGQVRGLSHEICQRLEIILGEDDNPSYWSSDEPTELSPAVIPTPGSITPGADFESNVNGNDIQNALQRLPVPLSDEPREDYAAPVLNKNDWNVRLDNTLAMKLLRSLKDTNPLDFPQERLPSTLCAECRKFGQELLNPGSSFSYDVEPLRKRSEEGHCQLCTLLWRACIRNGGQNLESVEFTREGAFVRMHNKSGIVLSVMRSIEDQTSMTNDFQVGFVDLPQAGGPTHLGMVRQWVEDCDNNNRHFCKPPGRAHSGTTGPARRLPTRLIDVVGPTSDEVRLWETGPNDVGEWVALSHQWGKRNFSTDQANLKSHIEGIKFAELPATFRDAVIVTRALGHRYLWIDSLCVVQGDGGDFKTEAKRMEDVYSGAYCVIAASCASDHYGGFLTDRKQRDCVGIIPDTKTQAPLYICQNIDNFQKHVLESDLNQRGWVLQEHALARRTIFFTAHQTYFECGGGIRCETSSIMKNKVASLLGDPNFPKSLYDASKGGKILQYQYLYQQYSRLGLSKLYDRPVAIQGLQQRLLDTMDVEGGWGIFDAGETKGTLRRSLLWCRGFDTPRLVRIAIPDDRAPVPSWSWMAYSGDESHHGGIDYVRLGFDGWIWEPLQPPRWPSVHDGASAPDLRTADVALGATARELDLGAAHVFQGDIVLDDPDTGLRDSTLCVVLGKAKGVRQLKDPELQSHCVLLVDSTGKKDADGQDKYERVGTALLPAKCIGRDEGFSIRIY